jgi:flagella basal body P-ring formation protein FlgA
MRYSKPFLFLLLATVWPAMAAPPKLQPQVQIDRETIRLSDVFDGLPPETDADIAVAPAPGRSVTYDYSILTKLARRYGLTWQTNNLADKTVITRQGQRITAAMIRDAVQHQLEQAGATGLMEIVLDQRNLEIYLPLTVKSDFAIHDLHYDQQAQRFRAELQVAADTPHFQQMVLTGRVVPMVEVATLKTSLSPGTTIGEGDIQWMKLPAERAGDALRQANAVVGMTLRRQLPEQSLLRKTDVMPPHVVLRGQIVTMRIRQQNLELSAQGRALQDGAVGEVVRITNTQSNRVVEAKVMAPGLVEIMTTPQLASLQQ